MAPEVMQAGDTQSNSPLPPHTPGFKPGTDKRSGYGRKADIWSLGMTLFELSTGTTPYKSAAAAIYAVCVNKKVPVFPEHYSSSAHIFLSRCLEIDPDQRASCTELRRHVFTTPPVSSRLLTS
jgi:serine/threonine protein kinase